MINYLNFNSHAPWGAWLYTKWTQQRLFKISTHTLRGERDVKRDSIVWTAKNFNSHAPWGAWRKGIRYQRKYWQFQLTRSVGSVTLHTQTGPPHIRFQLTRSVGSVTNKSRKYNRNIRYFNSHAPWGAWPLTLFDLMESEEFQLTRSVGSVT